MGVPDNGRGHIIGSLEAKRLIDQVDVVIDGLGNPHHRDVQAPPGDLPAYGVRSFEGSVSPNGKEHIHTQGNQVIHHIGDFLPAARRPQHGPPELVDVPNLFRGQVVIGMGVVGGKPLIPVRDANYFFNPVEVVKPHHQAAYHIVDSRA